VDRRHRDAPGQQALAQAAQVGGVHAEPEGLGGRGYPLSARCPCYV
jgi:hypothetical protein